MSKYSHVVFGLSLCLTLGLGAARASNPAFASSDDFSPGDKGNAHDGGGKGGKPGLARQISWDEFRRRCADPDSFQGDVQRAPKEIVIQCSDTHREYVSAEPGLMVLPNARTVRVDILSDKFAVTTEEMPAPLYEKDGSCFRFKEIQKDLKIERPMSCADIDGIKGNLEDYCVGAIDNAKSSNPKLIQVKETGNVLDTCAAFAPGGEKGKGGFNGGKIKGEF